MTGSGRHGGQGVWRPKQQGERPWPECVGQTGRDAGKVTKHLFDLLTTRGDDRHGPIGLTALRRKQSADRGHVERVDGEPVERVGRNHGKRPVPESVGHTGNRGLRRVIWIDANALHASDTVQKRIFTFTLGDT